MTRAFFSLLILALAGCQTVTLNDSVDVDFDFTPLVGPSDSLHSPYVAGAEFSLYAYATDDSEELGWTIESAAPDVLRVDRTADGSAEVTATGAGQVELSVRDEAGDIVHRADVEVRQPDRADVAAHGPLIVRRPELERSNLDEVQVLVGGTATFLVRWYAGEQELSGNGALQVDADPGVTGSRRRTFLFEDREWLTLSVATPGRHEVRLLAGGEVVRTLTVIGVEEAAVDQILLHGMDETDRRDGEILTVLAQAYDTDGEPIYGVEYAWDVDGAAEAGLGDLYRYEFLAGNAVELCARHAGMEVRVTIQSAGGFVDSTNRIGCTIAGAGLARSAALSSLAFLVPFALVLRRRLRR